MTDDAYYEGSTSSKTAASALEPPPPLVTVDPSEAEQALWKEFTGRFDEEKGRDRHALVEDAIEIYLTIQNVNIRALAQNLIVKMLPDLQNADLLYRIASSTRTSKELASWACFSFLKHMLATREELEALMLRNTFTPDIRRCIARRLISSCSGISQGTRLIIVQNFPEMLNAMEREQFQQMDNRLEYLATLFDRIDELDEVKRSDA